MSDWTRVSPDAARAHPKGRPGPFEYACAAVFLWLAAGDLLPFATGGMSAGSPLHLLWGTLNLTTAVLLALGAPLARPLGILMGFREVFAFLLIIGNTVIDPQSAGFDAWQTASVTGLVNGIAGFAAAFHLMTGDRPNLIYAHRYRRYSDV